MGPRKAWQFLRPHVQQADAVVFSREAYVWEGSTSRRSVIPPSIDAFSAKNQDMDAPTAPRSCASPVSSRAAARAAGVQPARRDARAGRPARRAVRARSRCRGVPAAVIQVSRWDRSRIRSASSRLPRRHRPARTRTWCWPGHRRPGSPTTQRGWRCWPRSGRSRRLPHRCASGSTSSPSRWTTSRRTRRS